MVENRSSVPSRRAEAAPQLRYPFSHVDVGISVVADHDMAAGDELRRRGWHGDSRNLAAIGAATGGDPRTARTRRSSRSSISSATIALESRRVRRLLCRLSRDGEGFHQKCVGWRRRSRSHGRAAAKRRIDGSSAQVNQPSFANGRTTPTCRCRQRRHRPLALVAGTVQGSSPGKRMLLVSCAGDRAQPVRRSQDRVTVGSRQTSRRVRCLSKAVERLFKLSS